MLFFKTKKQVKALELKVCELEAQVEGLQYKKQIETLKEELADLKFKKKIELEDIEHMTRITEEKLNIEHERKITELEGKKIKEVADIRDEYRLKTEKHLLAEKQDFKDMHNSILERLPNVRVNLKGDV